jgi:hypothetical protein
MGPKKDDIIKIKYWDTDDGDDECYQIDYFDADAATPSGYTRHSSSFLTGEQVDSYLQSLFILLTRDKA